MFKVTLKYILDGVETIESRDGYDTPYDAFLFAEDTALIDNTISILISKQ